MLVDSMKTGDDTLQKLTHLNMAVACPMLEERNWSNQMEASAVIHDIPTLTFCGSCWHFDIQTNFVFTPENKTLNFQLLFITMWSVSSVHPSLSPTISLTWSLIYNPSLTLTSSLSLSFTRGPQIKISLVSKQCTMSNNILVPPMGYKWPDQGC